MRTGMRLLFAAVLAAGLSTLFGGSIFLTGHDPDFHASLGGNNAGARKINTTAIGFIQDASFNTFVGVAPKFLFVESSISPPGGHTTGMNGIIASGYTQGVSFDHSDASTLNAALNLLGVAGGYSAIVIASDFGGVLTSAELNILNARSADIIAFLNAGGGLYAMAESNSQAHLTTGSTLFGFLPFVVSSSQLNQSEVGFTVTSFGAGLGLTVGDINGNASHNIFNGAFGMNPVDLDGQGNILSLATRSQVSDEGVVPEPGTAGLAALGMGVALAILRRRRGAPPPIGSEKL